MEEKDKKEAKALFNAAYNDDPAQFKTVFDSAVKRRIGRNIKAMRSDMRDATVANVASQDKTDEPE